MQLCRYGSTSHQAINAVTDEAPNRYIERWNAFLGNCQEIVAGASPLMASGHLTRINGLVMEATGLKLPLGSSCRIIPIGGSPVEAEVVGFNGERLFLMPSEDVYGLSPGARVIALEPQMVRPKVGRPVPARRRAVDRAKPLQVGDALLGRVVDGAGRPLDRGGPIVTDTWWPL